jgi:hypothetical protein
MPTINELLIYTPASDFALSKRFYAALGFEITEAFAGDADCRLGGAAFRLQNYYQKDWAENFMMKFGVADLEAWHTHAKAVIDTGDFPDTRYSRIEQAGGSDIFHVWDPSGILLIFVN